MSKVAGVLTMALSKDLQATVRAHTALAARLLEPADALLMPLVATVEASGGAIGSIAATLANAAEEGANEARIAELVAEQIERHHSMLLGGADTIVAGAMAAIAAEKARAA